MSSDVLFRFEDVGVVYDGRAVLDHLDLEIPGAGITAIVGPSGSGKSTLLRLCNRLAVPDHGRVMFRGEALATRPVLDLRRRVGMVFQRPTMFPGTVRDNLRVAEPGASDDQLRQVLERVSLSPSFLDRTGDELSGGEAQRACLARTLLCRPEVLLADEPTSALDRTATAALETLGHTLAGDGVPVLWVTHDLDQADRLADRQVVVVDGHVAGARERDDYLASWRPDRGRHRDGDREAGAEEPDHG